MWNIVNNIIIAKYSAKWVHFKGYINVLYT